MLRMYGIDNAEVNTRDRMEALNFLFGMGRYTGRDIRVVPRLVLLEPHTLHMDERTRLPLLHRFVHCPEEGDE